MRSFLAVEPGARFIAALEVGLDACVFLFLPMLVLASKGAAPLASLAGVCAFGLAAPHGAAAWRPVRGLAGLLAVLVLCGLLSSLWAIQPQRSLLIAARLAGLFAAGLALMAAADRLAAPQRLLACFAAGLAVALVLAVVQLASGGVLTEHFAGRAFLDPTLNQVENGFALLLLPLTATLVLQRRRWLAGALGATTVVVIALLVGDAGRIAFAAGVAGALLIYWRRQPMIRLAAAVSVVMILTAPTVFPPLADIGALDREAHAFKFSAWHRLQIWAFVGSRIAERPLLGWGLDSSRAIPGGNARTVEGHELLPLHPHNAPLQLWLELGLPGGVLFALFALRLWRAFGAAPWPRLYAAAAGGSLVTALTLSLGAYGIWQEWWISTEFLALFLILAMAQLARLSTAARSHRPPAGANLRGSGP